jgi:hypothetical protein
VRPSKRGEALVKRKLGLQPAEDKLTDNDPELTTVFTGLVDEDYLAALRDMLPAAQAFSDVDLLVATCQANNTVCAC